MRRTALLPAGAIALVGALTLVPADAQAESETVRFEFTGGNQEFVVPDGVTEVEVEACGASGGLGGSLAGGLPGWPTSVFETLAVTPGETLTVVVGGAGGPGTFDMAASQIAGGGGGFNGGGAGGGADGNGDLASGGGGGGASDVRQGGTGLAERVIVSAGGGGGGAHATNDDTFEDPGFGGGAGVGRDGGPTGDPIAGQGATSGAGGTGGLGDYDDGLDGALGLGGDGGAGGASNSRGGGGGGGGLYGGGGGGAGDLQSGGGGGAGSDLGDAPDPSLPCSEGDGYVELTYVLGDDDDRDVETPDVVPGRPTFTG